MVATFLVDLLCESLSRFQALPQRTQSVVYLSLAGTALSSWIAVMRWRRSSYYATLFHEPPALIPAQDTNEQNTNEEDEEMYDCVVVGAGPAGSAAAFFIAKLGGKVLMVDRYELID